VFVTETDADAARATIDAGLPDDFTEWPRDLEELYRRKLER
jgi:hypothetical protein